MFAESTMYRMTHYTLMHFCFNPSIQYFRAALNNEENMNNSNIKKTVMTHITFHVMFQCLHTCSVIQPRCLTSMPSCMLFNSSFTRGRRLAAPAWMALYQDWAMAGSFARRNTEFFLLDEITSKYLAEKMRGVERVKQKRGS